MLIYICYRGSLKDNLEKKEGYSYRKYFDSYNEVFNNSSLFKRGKIEGYNNKTVYESKNGIICIEIDYYNPLTFSGFEPDEEEWGVDTYISNYTNEFIEDIVKAYEEFYGVKINYQIYESKDGTPFLVISDEEISDNEDVHFLAHFVEN